MAPSIAGESSSNLLHDYATTNGDGAFAHAYWQASRLWQQHEEAIQMRDVFMILCSRGPQKAHAFIIDPTTGQFFRDITRHEDKLTC